MAVLVALTGGLGAWRADDGTVEGGRAPAFALKDLRDPRATVSLAQLRGRPVVLNFWASWCVPCRKEMPAFETVHRRVGDRIAFIGIDHEDNREEALAFLDETGVSYRSGYDPEGKVARAYGAVGLPTTVLVTPQGTVALRHTGPLSERALLREIARHFQITQARP